MAMRFAQLSTTLRIGVLLTAALAAYGIGSAQAADKTLYKWTDGEGQVHYSERKPVGVDAEAFKVSGGRPANPGDDAASNGSTRSSGTETAAAAGGDQEDPEAFKDPERCEVARKNLETINNNARIRMKDPETDEYRYLTPDEITQKKQEAQKAIDESC